MVYWLDQINFKKGLFAFSTWERILMCLNYWLRTKVSMFIINDQIINLTNDLQLSGDRLISKGRTLPFTVWNRALEGEIRYFRHRGCRFPIGSLLQPDEKGDCTAMILLFGRVPSWYSWPCVNLKCYFGPVICKKRLEAWRISPYHVTTGNYFTICHSQEVFALSSCFKMKWNLNILPLNEPSVTREVQQYFVNIFSFITRYTRLNYQLWMKIRLSGENGNDTCIEIAPTTRLSYDITRYKPSYKSSDSHRSLSIVRGNVDTRVHCQANQVTSKDGSCLSHHSACSLNHNPHDIRCSCQLKGRIITDRHFCLNVCMPKNCTCSRHYFQCTSGGCIHMSSVCDRMSHCRDSSDEICTIKFHAPEYEENDMTISLNNILFCLGFLCNSGQCVYLKNVNDLIPDCTGGKAEDEPLFLDLRYNNKQYSCNDYTQIPCVPGLPVCFTFQHLCLFDSDQDGNPLWCRNGAHLGECAGINCTNSYKCPASYCIPFHRVCDGYPHCIHGEYEERCDTYWCKGLLRCTGTKICVHPTHVCDGLKNCPSGEDEELCDLNFCPHSCDCLSYSITCADRTSDTIPIMPSKSLNHISIVSSHMPYPDFYNIRDQRKLLILNLTGNHIQNICVSLEDDGKFYGKSFMLDLSHNEITTLQPACFEKLVSLKFLSLASNPLQMLQKNSLSLLSISYISIRSSKIKSLYGNSFNTNVTNYHLDITDIRLDYLDSLATEILSHYFYLKFDDSRLCCILYYNTYCLNETKLAASCPTLLPHRLIGYVILPIGIGIIATNLYAFQANVKQAKASHFTKIMSFLILVDTMMASYLPIIWVADLYYKSTFVLAMERWHKGVVCQLMESVSTITTILSPVLSGLLVFLISQGITNVNFSIVDYSNIIIFALDGITITMIRFSLSLTKSNMFQNGHLDDTMHMCNIMSNFNATSKIVISMKIALSVIMLAMELWTITSAIKMMLHIRQTTKEVEIISKIKLGSSRVKSGAYKFIMSVIFIKLVTYVPYPLLQIIHFLTDNVPEISGTYVMLSFIILECSLNPIAFVLRPLSTQKKKL